MTAQPLMPPARTAGKPYPAKLYKPKSMQVAPQEARQSIASRLWNAFLAGRRMARMRNLAEELEPHLLEDVGAPQWLVNEAALRRELARMRNVDYLRW